MILVPSPRVDISRPDSFQARRDPFSLDFEKIALRRAAKQAEFHHKYDDDQNMRKYMIGDRFTSHSDHRSATQDQKEKKDDSKHAAMAATFREKEEEYHEQRLMKPRFEDFKLQFTGLQRVGRVADGIPLPSEDKVEKQPEEPPMKPASQTPSAPREAAQSSSQRFYGGEQRRLEELGIGLDDFFDKMPKTTESQEADAIPAATD